MQTSNPTLTHGAFEQSEQASFGSTDVMTMQGTGVKTGILVVLAMASAGLVWFRFNQNPTAVMPWVLGGLIVGLVLSLITTFRPHSAPWSAPGYAIAEGFFLGGISAIFDQRFPGLPFQAVCLTFGILFSMAVAYQTQAIRVTDKFRKGMFAAMGAICLLYLASFIMRFFGMSIPFIHEGGMLGIGFSVVVVVIASLALLLDFDFIEQQAHHGAPKYMEWYGAFALMTTLVWLYIEVLRLLAKLNRND